MAVFRHGFTLPMQPEEALALFTPRGEEGWVPVWAPRYIDPPDGETAPGMIFATHGDSVWWTCLEWDPAGGGARYLRLTPTVKVARVGITCRAEGEGTRVEVLYDWHPLGPQGAEELAAMTDSGFAAEIEGWRALILAA